MQVDGELELGRLQHRKLCRLSAIDDAAGISPDLTESVRKICPVAHYPARFDELANSKTGRQSVARCHNGKLNAAAIEQRIPADEEGLATLAHHACEGYIDFVAGVKTWICRPRTGAAACTSFKVRSADAGFAGLTNTAMRAALGTSSCRRPSRFAVVSCIKKLTPVMLPPGRARLATRPS